MTWPQERLETLIDSGILEKANTGAGEGGDVGRTFSWVKIFSIPEVEKKRFRVIIEPRSLNEGYKRGGVSLPLVLPTLHQVEKVIETSTHIRSIDFKSFFYQILLGANVRQFFRAHINNEVYNVCVLPQGACFSPFIAQMFSKAVTRHMFPLNLSIVYIDNIYVSNSQKDPEIPCIFEIGSDKRGSEGTILGLKFDCARKTISIGGRLKEKLRSHTWRNRISVGCVLRVAGRLFFAARVLHIPMCIFQRAMLVISEVSGLVSQLRRDEYDTSILLNESLTSRVRTQMASLLTAAKDWETYQITPDEVFDHYTFTDASNDQGAFVTTDEKEAYVTSWSFNEETSTHDSINVKELRAIRKAITSTNRKAIHIVTDSLVSIFAILKGWSKSDKINDEVTRILQQQRQIWLSWVPTEENVADGPSRGLEIYIFHLGKVWYHAVPCGAVFPSQKNVDRDLYRLQQKPQNLPAYLELCLHKSGDAVVKAFHH